MHTTSCGQEHIGGGGYAEVHTVFLSSVRVVKAGRFYFCSLNLSFFCFVITDFCVYFMNIF